MELGHKAEQQDGVETVPASWQPGSDGMSHLKLAVEPRWGPGRLVRPMTLGGILGYEIFDEIAEIEFPVERLPDLGDWGEHNVDH